MKLNVGSKNEVKVSAVRDAVLLYPDLFSDPEVVGIEIQGDTFGHPKNITETIQGAIDRAKSAFMNCSYSFGIEGGLMEAPFSKTGYLNVEVCAIYDGNVIALGISPGFEWPKAVTELIIFGRLDASQAFNQLRLTNSEKLGAERGGIVGFLTKGRLTREEQTKQAVIMALIQLERPELYQ